LDEGIADTLVSDGAANESCLLVLGNFARRESVRSFLFDLHPCVGFFSSLVEEVSEIAGPVIQRSANRSRSAREPGKEE
jgi:hypothetical protein